MWQTATCHLTTPPSSCAHSCERSTLDTRSCIHLVARAVRRSRATPLAARGRCARRPSSHGGERRHSAFDNRREHSRMKVHDTDFRPVRVLTELLQNGAMKTERTDSLTRQDVRFTAQPHRITEGSAYDNRPEHSRIKASLTALRPVRVLTEALQMVRIAARPSSLTTLGRAFSVAASSHHRRAATTAYQVTLKMPTHSAS